LGILSVKIDKTDIIYEGIQKNYARSLEARLPFIELLEDAFKE